MKAAESKEIWQLFYCGIDVPATLQLTYRQPFKLRTSNPLSYVPVTLRVTYRLPYMLRTGNPADDIELFDPFEQRYSIHSNSVIRFIRIERFDTLE